MNTCHGQAAVRSSDVTQSGRSPVSTTFPTSPAHGPGDGPSAGDSAWIRTSDRAAAGVDAEELRQELESLANELMVDVSLEGAE